MLYSSTLSNIHNYLFSGRPLSQDGKLQKEACTAVKTKGAFFHVDPHSAQTKKNRIWRCMHRASSYNMYINQQIAQNSSD